jgi:hypothetical protein
VSPFTPLNEFVRSLLLWAIWNMKIEEFREEFSFDPYRPLFLRDVKVYLKEEFWEELISLPNFTTNGGFASAQTT